MYSGSRQTRQSASGREGLHPRGFTLIELLVTVAILAILLALAVPSFTAIINNNRLAGQANEVVGSLQLARVEAVRQNRRAIVCRSTNGTSCAGAGQWTTWITFLDMNNDGAGTAAEVIRVNTAKAPVRVTSGIASISFRPDGLARNTATGALADTAITVCIPTTRPAQNRRVVSIGPGGSRISTASANGAGLCP